MLVPAGRADLLVLPLRRFPARLCRSPPLSMLRWQPMVGRAREEGGSRRWATVPPSRPSTHDYRPRPTPLPPERPPPISRAVLSSEPNWYSTRGVHTHKKESSKGKRGGGASQRPSPVCRPTSTVRAHQPSRERSELCVQQSSTVLPGHTPGTRTPSVASLSHQGGRPPRRARGRSGSTAGSGRLGGGGRGGGPTPPHGRETSPPAIRELQRL